MEIKSYRELEVWQKSMDLALECYQMTNKFPKSETYGISSQLQRAAISVPANIAEGRSRRHTKEFIQHLSIAYGSLAEVETYVLFAGRLNYITKDQLDRFMLKTAEIGRMINGLQKSLKKNLIPDP